MAAKATSGIRKSVRFAPDALSVAQISFKNRVSFKPELVALILNESFTGCALLVNSDDKISTNDDVIVKLGEMSPMRARVVWSKNLEENIYKIGIKWL